MAVSQLEAATAAIDASMPGTWKAKLLRASDVKPARISWIWPGWIAGGKLTVLAGDGGTGKTTLMLGLIATLTSGGRWPDGERCTTPGNVIIWSSEDDPSDTLVPRLIAAGADLDRVYFADCRVNEFGEREPFDPANDIDLLREQIGTIGGVSLVMLDPVVSAIKGDMNKANDVRRGLQAVVDLASDYGAAVVGISHLGKGTRGNTPVERVIGSQAFSALSRTTLMAAKQEDSDMRALVRAKSNIAPDDGGVSYAIELHTIDGGIEAVRAVWGDKIEGTAREILRDVEHVDTGETTEVDDAGQYLRDLLADGPIPSKQVYADADGAGFSRSTIRRAQKEIGIEAYRDGEGIGSKSRWFWRLPPNDGFTKMLTETPKMLTEKSEHLSRNVSTLAEKPDSDMDAETVKIRTGTL